MTINRAAVRAAIGALALTAAAALPALADMPITIEADKSIYMPLPSTPGAVVIGNPSIVDATLHGDKIFIHGRAFGQTNLTIIDLAGNEMAGYDITVKHTVSNAVALFRGPNRQSYSCAPYCEADIQVGDDLAFFKTTVESAQKKTEFATGSKTAEAAAPAAPQ